MRHSRCHSELDIVILNSIQNLSGELQPFMYAAMPFLDWTLVHAHPREILNPVQNGLITQLSVLLAVHFQFGSNVG